MKKIYALICLLIIQSISHSQNPQIQWTKNFFYGNEENHIKGIAVDKQDNIYITGNYVKDNYPNPLLRGTFINKTDPAGNIIWSDTTAEINASTNVIALSDNHVYTIGQSFIKRKFNGDTVWGQNITGHGIAYFNNAVYIVYDKLYKYDLNGNLILSTPIGSGVWAGGIQIKTSENYLYVRQGDGNNYNPCIIHKYDTLGNLIWSKPSSMGYVWNMATDTTGNCYVIGSSIAKKINSNGVTEWVVYNNATQAWYNAAINNDTVYLCGLGDYLLDTISGSAICKSSIFIYSSQTGQLLSTHLFDFFPNEPEKAKFILKEGNDIYLAGAGGSQMGTLYLAKVSLNNLSASVNENTKDENIFSLNVYPNPAGGNFQINYSSTEKTKLQLNIIDSKGKTVYTETFQGDYKKEIDLGTKAKGVYFIEIVSSDKKRAVKRIVLN